GHWGAGKTYYIKKTLFPKILSDTKLGFTPLMISLFGENDPKKISTKIIQELYSFKGGSKIKSKSIINSLKKLSETIRYIKKYVDTDEVINLLGSGIFNLLKAEKIVLFFDDLERLGTGFKVDDFLGYVNDLSENKGCKI